MTIAQRVILKGGKVLAFGGAEAAISDVSIEGGHIGSIGAVDPRPGDTVIDVSGAIVLPALSDIHTHIYWGATSLGVKPEIVAHRSGTGVFVDAGSAGAGNFVGLRAFVFDPSPFHTYAFLNVSFPGIFGFSKRVMVGECCDIRLADPDACIEAALAHPDKVVGIKVRAGRKAAGDNGARALEIALNVAERVKLPVMCHVDLDPPSIDDVLRVLRKGDIITHCCRPDPNAATIGGHVIESAWQARERGVHFDIGHGMGGFSFGVCREMLAEGFVPDLISSDIHTLSVDGPAFDLLTTINKLIALGVDPTTALACGSANPATVIGHPELGRIAVGDEANIAVLKWRDEPWVFHDASGEALSVERRLVCERLIVRGQEITAEGGSQPLPSQHS
nr:amidohydrolase/deacetylase family metallohydrolase [Mesorhizobium loti]